MQTFIIVQARQAERKLFSMHAFITVRAWQAEGQLYSMHAVIIMQARQAEETLYNLRAIDPLMLVKKINGVSSTNSHLRLLHRLFSL